MSIYSENLPPSLKGAIEWMLPLINESSTVLDIGCSTGYFGKFLKDTKNCAVYGVEISEDIKQAKKVLDGTYTFDLDGEWPKDVYERKYDYVFFGDVLEHLKDSEQALRKTIKLLKPGGKVFVSVPNVAHISVRLELLNGGFEYEPMGILDRTHLKYFTLDSFKALSVSAGYHVDSVDYSVNDYPYEVVKKMVKKAGLTADKRFWDIVNSIEARAFQYKFVLSIGGSAKKTILKDLPQKPEKYRDSYIAEYEDRFNNLHKHADDQAKIIEQLKSENEIQRAQLEKIHTSKAWKLLHTGSKIKKSIRR